MSTATLPALTDQTPAQIDTQLAEIWGRINAVTTGISAAKKMAREATKAIRQGYKYYQDVLDTAEAKVVELQAKLPALKAEAAPFEDEFDRRGGWTRAFLVNNSNGHVHSNMRCSTCYITTQFMWLIDYSGKNEDQVVEDAGMRACTVCYPSAPVDVLARPTKIFGSPEEAAKAAAAPADCAGSGTWDYPRETARMGYCAGNYGVCSHCGDRVTISSTGKMRKHKAKKG